MRSGIPVPLRKSLGDVPILYPRIGGHKLLRGFDNEKYKAKNSYAGQTEFRFPSGGEWRHRFCRAGGSGRPYDEFGEISASQGSRTPAHGTEKQRINVRFDFTYNFRRGKHEIHQIDGGVQMGASKNSFSTTRSLFHPGNFRALKSVIILCTITFVTLGLSACSFARIPDLFRLNKECQEEGYYMGEFEFKMLGFAYLLDKGHYLEANRGIEKLYNQLKNREGLIKVPKFADKNQEMDFYLNLQNPRTGAFMNDSFPYCTFEGPTGNELIHLETSLKNRETVTSQISAEIS
jgi:hypothetical protein